MIRRYSPIRLLVLIGLLVAATQLAIAQSRAIRPVTIQIPNQGQFELYKGSYALVIGASDYQDNSWGDLSSVREDVKAVREALEEQGFRVDTLLDPTEDALIDEINDFIDAHGYDRENRLLFYYAGHGYTQERNGRKFGYLVPVDAPNPYDNERAFFRKSLKMEQVLSWAKQIESKHALFVFDSCFSGSVLQSRAVAVPEDISYLTAKPVRQFISAGSANQTVPAISVFRPLFIRGINGQADLDKDGYVTGVELGMYLQKQVPRYQTGQTPQYGKILDPYLDEGNFVFEIQKQKPTPRVQAIPPAVTSVQLGDLQKKAKAAEQALLEQQEVQQQWKDWQQKMKKDYENALIFEKEAVGKELKIESWQRFLSNWKDKNPYSQQDAELRSGAELRLDYWMNSQMVDSAKRPQATKKQSGKTLLEELVSWRECIECDFSDTDLSSLNLGGVNLLKAKLIYTKMREAYLKKSNLIMANLTYADLSRANLSEANLNKATLWFANLRGATLKKADLSEADLSEADLSSTNLVDANLNGTNLRKSNLSYAYLTGANLTGANLTGAKFCKTVMPNGETNNEDC